MGKQNIIEHMPSKHKLVLCIPQYVTEDLLRNVLYERVCEFDFTENE
jgi:hypothetical protein